jgi:hypothetical protein
MGIMQLVARNLWGFAWVEVERSEEDAKAYWRTRRLFYGRAMCDGKLFDLFNLRYQDSKTRCLFSKLLDFELNCTERLYTAQH